MKKYIIALDQGTTSSRAMVFDHEGNIIASAQKELTQIYPRPGYVEQDPLEIYVDGNSIVLRKYRPSCIFCDSTKDVRTFRGKNVCPRCLRELRERT